MHYCSSATATAKRPPFWLPQLAYFILFLLCPTVFAAFENNGSTPYPIWSELSYFERSTIGDLAKARNNDPEALLALYLLASGVREFRDYNLVNDQIKKFIKRSQHLIIEEDNQVLTGDILTREMHNTFFSQGKEDQTLKGYDADQSRLMGIFENGSFNCISSSLLYSVIASHFNLNIDGALLPSHAFIQLNIRGGEKIDIETTSPSGFNQKHNEDFYKKQNKEWFSDRNLEPASYQDYLKREIVSPTILGAKNMLNQHTGIGLMDLTESGRLAEISAYIDPHNILANEKRLYFYGTQVNEMINTKQWRALLKLYKTTYVRVMNDSAYFNQSEALQSNLRVYLSGAILAYAKEGNIEQTLTVMGELLNRGLSSPENQNDIENRVVNAVKLLLTTLANQNRYNEGLLALSLIEGHLSNPEEWSDMLSWFYLRWAKQSWDEKDWQEVIAILAEYLDHPSPALNRTHISKTMGDAYTNWVLEAINNKDLDTANIAIEQCEDTRYTQVCSDAQKTLKRAKKNKTII